MSQKNRMTARVLTFWHVDVTSLPTCVSTMRILAEIMFISKAIKSHLKGHMINRILHSLSFHMKFGLILYSVFGAIWPFCAGVP